MIYDQWALTYNLSTIGILAFVVASIFSSTVFWSIKGKLADYAVSTRKSLLWLFVLTPWFIAFSAALILSPLFQDVSALSWLTDLAHWHHPDIFYFLSWHSFSLLVFVAFSLYVFTKKMVVLYHNHHQISVLRAFGIRKSKQVTIIESPIPTAFTGGLLNPSCFISTGLIEKTSAAELEIIIQHEIAHVRNYDPLKKWLFSFLSAYFTNNVKSLLISMMSLSMEQDADSFFVKNQQQSQNVATTLIKFTKLAANYSIHPQYKSELFVHFCRHSIEQRVLHLLNDKKFKPFPKRGVSIVILLLVLVSTTSVDSLHHAIETLFTH